MKRVTPAIKTQGLEIAELPESAVKDKRIVPKFGFNTFLKIETATDLMGFENNIYKIFRIYFICKEKCTLK